MEKIGVQGLKDSVLAVSPQNLSKQSIPAKISEGFWLSELKNYSILSIETKGVT